MLGHGVYKRYRHNAALYTDMCGRIVHECMYVCRNIGYGRVVWDLSIQSDTDAGGCTDIYNVLIYGTPCIDTLRTVEIDDTDRPRVHHIVYKFPFSLDFHTIIIHTCTFLDAWIIGIGLFGTMMAISST